MAIGAAPKDHYGCKARSSTDVVTCAEAVGAGLTALAAGELWDAVAAKGFLDAPGGWGADPPRPASPRKD